VRVRVGFGRRDLVKNGDSTSKCILANTGWTDEARAASLAVRRAKAAARKEQRAREEMFERQREESGRDFIEGWYPRGRDGFSEDPHYGTSTPKAPYGYLEGTMDPRKEPLYDRYGRPIIPRPWEDYHPPKRGGHWEWVKADPRSVIPMPIYVGGGESERKNTEWLEKVKAAEELWGRFGKKKRWMDKNPEATEADWEKHDAEQLRQWIKRKREEERAEAEARRRGESVDFEADSEDTVEDARTGATRRNRLPMNTLILERDRVV
jgi:hypothetical protein